jgi:hypothetical protein
VVEGETREAYRYVANAVKEAARNLLCEDVSMAEYGISDNVPHVRKAMEEVFEKLMMINCYSHLAVIGMRPNSGGVYNHLAKTGNAPFLSACIEAIHNLTTVEAVCLYFNDSFDYFRHFTFFISLATFILLWYAGGQCLASPEEGDG